MPLSKVIPPENARFRRKTDKDFGGTGHVGEGRFCRIGGFVCLRADRFLLFFKVLGSRAFFGEGPAGARGGALALLVGALAAAPDTPGRYKEEVKRGLTPPFQFPGVGDGRKT